jgi:hypothetical protein
MYYLWFELISIGPAIIWIDFEGFWVGALPVPFPFSYLRSISMANLTNVDYWENNWKGLKLPQVYYSWQIHEFHQLFKHFMPQSKSLSR